MQSVPERLRALLTGARRRLADSRAWRVRAVLLVVLLLLLSPTVVSAATDQGTRLGPGTVERPADNTTYVSVQGFHFKGVGNAKKPARVVAADGRANGRELISGVDNDLPFEARWFYDADPLPDGNLLVTSTNPQGTVVFSYDPAAGEVAWYEQLPYHDTHDVDLIDGDQLLVANMRQYENGVSNDRLLVYDRPSDEVVWEWTFHEHYPNSTDGGFRADWSHVNDVDKVDEGRYLASPRNFDQVILVNRSTKEIEYRLGGDDDHDRLFEQHNPDFFIDEDGTPTILVADSENDRVVEYEKRGDDWECTWTVGEGQFTWPRDADRLPNGNTLVVDSMNHRVVEVTPQGEIVWEFYSPWAPYDVERIGTGPGSNGPTMADQNATGEYDISGSAGLTPGTDGSATFSTVLGNAFAGTPIEGQVREFAAQWDRVTPWIKPVWMTGWDFVFAILAGLVLVGWTVGELVYQRDRIRRRVGGLVG